MLGWHIVSYHDSIVITVGKKIIFSDYSTCYHLVYIFSILFINHTCLIITKEKHHLEALTAEYWHRIWGGDFKIVPTNEQVSPSATRWWNHHALSLLTIHLLHNEIHKWYTHSVKEDSTTFSTNHLTTPPTMFNFDIWVISSLGVKIWKFDSCCHRSHDQYSTGNWSVKSCDLKSQSKKK